MTRRHPLETRVPPPVVLLGAAALQRRLPRRPVGAGRRALAATTVAAAVAMVADADLRFKRNGTTVLPHAPERASRLVTGGVYQVTRNPMYVAMAGVLVAHAVARGRVAALLPAAAWVGYIDRFQVQPEERALERVFGEEYAAYRRRVRRWL